MVRPIIDAKPARKLNREPTATQAMSIAVRLSGFAARTSDSALKHQYSMGAMVVLISRV
jgi:hypothetical protein